MIANFNPSLALVLVHEGGFVNDPRDPGGATNKGITQAVYDDWRAKHDLAKQSVQSISQAEVGLIYKHNYWDAVQCDQLPLGVDYCVFDFAVNSGANRAARYLQRACGVADDGQIGAMTIAAVNAKPAVWLVNAVCDARLAFLRQLKTFDHFGKGWTARVNEVRAKAKEMVA